MSTLPTELVERIVLDDCLDNRDWLTISMVSWLFHTISVPLMYANPLMTTCEGALCLYHTLHDNPRVAGFVKTFVVRHAELASEHIKAGDFENLTIPALPNCTDLRITARRQHGRNEDMHAMSFTDCLRCSTQCPSLEKLSIRHLDRAGTVDGPFSIPNSLHTLSLINPIVSDLPQTPFDSEVFWNMCSTWLRNFELHSDLKLGSIFDRSDKVLSTLTEFHVYTTGSNLIGWDGYITSNLVSAEKLTAPLQLFIIGAKMNLPNLRTFNALLYATDDVFLCICMDEMARMLDRGRFPVLGRLELKPMMAPSNSGQSIAPATERLSRVARAVQNAKLPSRCSNAGVRLVVRGDESC
jgi:hypothetical protein